VDLPGVVNLAELDIADPAAKIDPGPPVRITTPAVLGAFGVQMPIHAAGKLAFPRWAHFRLRVLSGRIGLAAINRDGAMLTRSGLLLPSPEPVDVAIATPPGAVYVVLFNNEDPGSSQVEILDAAAVAAPPDSAVYRRLIEVEGASIVLGVPAELRPPAHAVRLESAIQLPESPLNVTTPASHGAFAVNLPLHWPEGVAGDAWVQLRLRVISGRVGLAVAGSKGEIRARTTEFLPPTPEPVVVALKVPAQSRGANFVVFNENPASPSRVEILEAAVVVAK
jgi:hypothetical protein